MALTRQQILDTVLLAYALSADDQGVLAAGLAGAQLAAMSAIYRQAASTAGASASGWQPTEEVQQSIQDQAASLVSGIADTFLGLVQSAADSFLDGWEALYGDLEGAASALASALTGAVKALTGWKADQIVDTTLVTGMDDGTEAFCQDYLAGDLIAGDEIDPSQLMVAVIPIYAVGEDCEPYAGEMFDIEDYQLIPDFPIHPLCPHRKTVVYLGDGQAA